MSAERIDQDHREDAAAPAAPRLVAKRLSLRVSGARIGDVARPAASGAPAVAPRPRALGLRVHGSPIGERVAQAAAPARPADHDDGGYAWDRGPDAGCAPAAPAGHGPAGHGPAGHGPAGHGRTP